jgi:2-phosphoglycerate kinase
MAKTLVIDPQEGTRAPFLRGILTRSLQDAGLAFEDAYRLASRVRQELGNATEITTGDLRRRVAGYLQQFHGAQVLRRYQEPVRSVTSVLVREGPDQVAPFSDAQYRRTLEICGLSGEVAAIMAARVARYLADRGEPEVSSATLGRMTFHWLSQDLGEEVARRYLVWIDFLHSGRPLIVLVGGTAGVGKSTVATDLATRLDIPRTQSTDMLREVMRMMIPERLLPVLFTSSFEAWRSLPRAQAPAADRDALMAEGYQAQADLISVPCEAVVRRALKERVSLIVEGVHVCPSLLERISSGPDAVVVPAMLAVLKPDLLRARIRGRGGRVVQRRAERYLQSFDAIWRLQEYLLSEADRQQIPIVVNEDKDRAVQAILSRVIDTLAQGFRSSPRTVFGTPDAPRKRA